jgi:hypothetical protein
MIVGLLDASVRSLSPSIGQASWNYANTPDDGGILGSDW